MKMIRILLLVSLAAFCLGHDADKSKWVHFVCDPNGYFQPSPALDAKLKKCPVNDCILTCQAEIMGWVNSDGSYSLEIFEEFIEQVAAPEYHDLVLNRIRECWQAFGSHIDPADKQCRASKQFADCSWSLLEITRCDPNKRPKE